MRFHHILDRLFANKTNIKVLRFFSVSGKEASVREIAREICVAAPNVAVSLRGLYNEGMLNLKKIGRAHVYALDEKNVFIRHTILPLFREERALFEQLKKAILPAVTFPYVSLILFGSVARGDERAKSDIDLAVIIGNKVDKDAAEEVMLDVSVITIQRFGNMLSPVIYHARDFVRLYNRKKPLIREIFREGKVLTGKSLSEIIIEYKR